ncbi:MAG: hypothetical protein KIS77_04985 [Saprospiraceae bacterium]|nr:hypothetical protein [Saprospiraceae bacterium]
MKDVKSKGIDYITVISGGRWVSTPEVFHRCFTAFACQEGVPTTAITHAAPDAPALVAMRVGIWGVPTANQDGTISVVPFTQGYVGYSRESSVYVGRFAFYQFWNTSVHELQHILYALQNPNGFTFNNMTGYSIWYNQNEIDAYNYQKGHISFDKLSETPFSTGVNHDIQTYQNRIKRLRGQ